MVKNYPPHETWRTIPGAINYEVSSNGNVRRLTAGQGAVAGKQLRLHVKKWGGRGYKYVCLRIQKNKGRIFYVHRLVALAFIGPQPTPRHEIAHKNGVGGDNHFKNLRWVTRKENEADKINHDRSNRGERHGMSRLTAKEILFIRKNGITPSARKQLAIKFATNERYIRQIVSRACWSSI